MSLNLKIPQLDTYRGDCSGSCSPPLPSTDVPQKVPKAAAFVTVSQGIADEYKKRFGFDSTLVVSATPYRELPVGVVGSPPRLVHMITLGSASEFAVLASALEARASVVAAGSMFVLNRKHRTVLTDSEKALSLD